MRSIKQRDGTFFFRYNRERCRVCDEKAELEVCPHCERRACAECRSNHMEMVKRDLGRLLNQVRLILDVDIR